jgi:ER protein Pkr1
VIITDDANVTAGVCVQPYLLLAMVVPVEPPDKITDADNLTASGQITPSDQDDLLSNILTPGSSLNPTFLLVVDGSLALLALTLLSLVVATGGNVHLIALLVVESALWVSIKW